MVLFLSAVRVLQQQPVTLRSTRSIFGITFFTDTKYLQSRVDVRQQASCHILRVNEMMLQIMPNDPKIREEIAFYENFEENIVKIKQMRSEIKVLMKEMGELTKTNPPRAFATASFPFSIP